MSHHESIIEYEWLTFQVGWDYYPASKGARERGSGVQLEPDEPESWEITEVMLAHPTKKDVKPVDVINQVSKKMMDYLNEQITEEIENAREPDERY